MCYIQVLLYKVSMSHTPKFPSKSESFTKMKDSFKIEIFCVLQQEFILHTNPLFFGLLELLLLFSYPVVLALILLLAKKCVDDVHKYFFCFLLYSLQAVGLRSPVPPAATNHVPPPPERNRQSITWGCRPQGSDFFINNSFLDFGVLITIVINTEPVFDVLL